MLHDAGLSVELPVVLDVQFGPASRSVRWWRRMSDMRCGLMSKLSLILAPEHRLRGHDGIAFLRGMRAKHRFSAATDHTLLGSHMRREPTTDGDAPLASRQHLSDDGSSLPRRPTGHARTLGSASARLVVCNYAGGGSDPKGEGQTQGISGSAGSGLRTSGNCRCMHLERDCSHLLWRCHVHGTAPLLTPRPAFNAAPQRAGFSAMVTSRFGPRKQASPFTATSCRRS
jgi:hypothetical protein